MTKTKKAKPDIKESLQKIAAFLKSHMIILCVVLFAILAGYLLMLTNQLTAQQPDQADITTKLSGVPHPKVDDKTVQTIKSLEDSNIEVKSIFEEARENPFNE